jgi:hypothetical protein
MTIASTQITATTPTVVYTSIGLTCCTVVYFCNTTTAPISIDIYVAGPTVTTPTDANIICKTYAIAATDTYIMNTERLMFENGDRLWVTTSVASSLTVTISYIEV